MSYSSLKKRKEIEAHHFIGKVLEHVLEYQNKNNIEGMCVANAQYMYDTIRMNFQSSITIEPVICIGVKKVNGHHALGCVVGHLIVKLDSQTILDPSYEVALLKDKQYFYNIAEIKKHIKKMESMGKKEKKYLINKINNNIENFIKFIEYAKKMNMGECLYSDRKYYDNLANYIEEKMKNKKKYIIDKKITSQAVLSFN